MSGAAHRTESFGTEGIEDVEGHVNEIKQIVGDDLVGLTTVVHVPGMYGKDVNGQRITRQISVIGIDDKTYAQVSDFSGYLLHAKNRERLEPIER